MGPSTITLAAALLSLSGTPGTPSVGSADTGPHEPSTEEAGGAILPATGDLLPGLVSAAVGLELTAPGLVSGGTGTQRIEGSVRVTGSIVHPFEGGVRGVALGLALFGRNDAKRLLERLGADPLALSDEQLRTPPPEPVVRVAPPVPIADELPPGESAEIDLSVPTGPIEIEPDQPLGFVGVVTDYDLVDPSPRDVLRIFEEGGAADHAAVARWMSADGTPWDGAQDLRRAVADDALARACRTRGPPRHGDFQRVHAYLMTLERLIGPGQTEPFLRCHRRLEFLLTGVALSYGEALRLERRVGIPVESMERMPSISNFLGLLDSAARSLRYRAPASLLELSFDRIDFPNAPPGVRPSPLGPHARAVLRPLASTDVGPILDLVGDEPASIREVLAFYVRMGHAPVLDHLVPWLLAHPTFAADLGRAAARRFPVAMSRRLLDAYVEATSPSARALVADLLRWVPEAGRRALVRHLAERVGVSVPEEASIAEALAAFDRARATRAGQEAGALLQYVLEGPDDVIALPQRIRRVERIADLSPAYLRDHAADLIAFLGDAALLAAADAPAERDLALQMLETLPWPERLRDDAARTAAIARARLLVRGGEHERALAALRTADPHLSDPPTQEVYERILVEAVDRAIDRGDFDTAEALLGDFRVRAGHPRAFSDLERRIFLTRYFPALVLGGLFALSLLATLVILGVRFMRTKVQPFLENRRTVRRMLFEADFDLVDDETRADATFLAIEADLGLGSEEHDRGLLGRRIDELDLTDDGAFAGGGDRRAHDASGGGDAASAPTTPSMVREDDTTGRADTPVERPHAPEIDPAAADTSAPAREPDEPRGSDRPGRGDARSSDGPIPAPDGAGEDPQPSSSPFTEALDLDADTGAGNTLDEDTSNDAHLDRDDDASSNEHRDTTGDGLSHDRGKTRGAAAEPPDATDHAASISLDDLELDDGSHDGDISDFGDGLDPDDDTRDEGTTRDEYGHGLETIPGDGAQPPEPPDDTTSISLDDLKLDDDTSDGNSLDFDDDAPAEIPPPEFGEHARLGRGDRGGPFDGTAPVATGGTGAASAVPTKTAPRDAGASNPVRGAETEPAGPGAAVQEAPIRGAETEPAGPGTAAREALGAIPRRGGGAPGTASGGRHPPGATGDEAGARAATPPPGFPSEVAAFEEAANRLTALARALSRHRRRAS